MCDIWYGMNYIIRDMGGMLLEMRCSLMCSLYCQNVWQIICEGCMPSAIVFTGDMSGILTRLVLRKQGTHRNYVCVPGLGASIVVLVWFLLC